MRLYKEKTKEKLVFFWFFARLFVPLQKNHKDVMALNLNKNLKLYYSIREVAEMFGLNESTLRFWETEFPYLKPKTMGPNKVRQYSEKDIEQVKRIHNLVKERGFKISAAKKIINNNRDGADKTADVMNRLIGVRDDLQALKKELDGLT